MDDESRFFTEREVIRELCKARIKLAASRHEHFFLNNIRPGNARARKESFGEDLSLDRLFPPRGQWHQFRPRWRRDMNGVPRTSTNVNIDTLFRAVMVLRERTPDARWAKELNAAVARILHRAFDEANFEFTTPDIVPAPKNPSQHEYRPLALYPLEDKIIDCLTAKYLRESLDSLLTPSCLAFRCRTPDRPPPTIHDALDRLVRLNRRHQKTGLFVAECDIKGFYDCVSHEVALRAIERLIGEVAERKGITIHARALAIFNAYLRSYSFSEDVAQGRGQTALKKKDAHGKYKWHLEDLQTLHGNAVLPRIGVPQGGALSCLIANAVLHEADLAVQDLERCSKEAINYMRYCDDMILMCADSKLCNDAFQTYQMVVRGLRLPIHPPKMLPSYQERGTRRQFYGGKSNAPYHWHTPDKGGYPWIQFVGYQLRHDGLIRVRRKSIRKEQDKIRTAADQLIAHLCQKNGQPIRRTFNQIVYRFRMKLISMAVGRASLGYPVSPELPMCWANGFRGLRGRQFVGRTLKMLDRCRERQIARVKAELLKLKLPTVARGDEKIRVLPHYGRPFSYWGQFFPTGRAPTR